MPYNEEKYLSFYLEGRSYPKLLKHHLDIDDLVDLILATNSKSLNAVIRESCAEAAKKLETGKVKKAWLAEHAAEIGAIGDGAATAVYQAWVDGRIDELAYATETGVIDAMNDRFGGESDDEEEEEEEEEEDDGSEDGEEDDE